MLFNNCKVAYVRFILSFVFDYFIVSIWNLEGLIICVLNGLIVSYCLSHLHRSSDCGLLIVNILSFIGNMLVSHNWLVIDVAFLNWNMFQPSFSWRGAQFLGYWLEKWSCSPLRVNRKHLRDWFLIHIYGTKWTLIHEIYK